MPQITSLAGFKEIYNSRFNNLVIFSVGMGVPYEQAKDIVQECFIKLWENSREIKNPSSWMFTVVRNSSINWLSSPKNSSSKKVMLNDNFIKPIEESDIEEAIEYFNKIEQAYKKIQLLSSRCKEIFVMTYIEQMKVKDVAKELEIAENTVKTYIKRAKEILQITTAISTGLFLLLYKTGNLIF